MTNLIFWLAWSFAGVGFLSFYDLHSNAIVLCFISLWLIAAVARQQFYKIAKVFHFVTLGGCIALVWSEYSGFRSVEATAGLFALLSVLKLWESKTTRDAFLFFLIFQLMMTAQYLLLESLWLLAFMLLTTLGMCAVFMNLQSEQRQNFSLFHPGKRQVLMRLMGLSTVLAVVLFFVFPRSNFTFFINPSKQSIHPWTGFSRELRPGQITNLMENDVMTFRVRFQKDVPALPEMYWQGATLIETDGFNWRPKHSLAFAASIPYSKADQRYPYQADMAESGDGALFVLSPVNNFKLLSKGFVRWRGLGDAQLHNLSAQKARWRGAVLAQSVRLPKELSEKLNSALQIPRDVKNWLVTTYPQLSGLKLAEFLSTTDQLFSQNFSYSLRPGTYSGSPLEQLQSFLQQRRVGVCEHFASAQALLLRAFGFPAVVMIGFQGGDYNNLGNYWAVRGRDAHAWLKVYDSKLGWIRHDPTSVVVPERIQLGATNFALKQNEAERLQTSWLDFSNIPWLGDISKFIDSTYYALNLAFISYDADSQKDILKQLGLEQWHRSWLKWLCFALVISTLIVFWWLQRRRLEGSWQQVNEMYQSFVKKLPEFDLKPSRSMPPLELRSNLSQKNFAQETLEFVDAYVQLKYGHLQSVPTKTQLRHLKKVLSQALRALRNEK